METLLQDLKYAARALRRNLVFTVAAVLTLAIAIGANTAVFSVVNAVLLRAMPYPDPDRLVVIWGTMPTEPRTLVSLPNIVEWRTRSRSFDELSMVRSQSVNLTGVDAPDRLVGSFVSANALTVLGARAERGRLFTPEEGGGQWCRGGRAVARGVGDSLRFRSEHRGAHAHPERQTACR